MQPRHRVSRAAIEHLKRFEGYRRRAARLADGRWTIGYGHTQTAREGAEVSEPDAEALLLYDLIAVAHVVNEATYAPLSQNQFDALCCFAFNIGLDAFRRSGVLSRLNEGAPLQAGLAMELWRQADVGGERIVVDALVRRRAVEKALFLTPAGEAFVPAPSPVLRPLVDYDSTGLVPVQAPVEVGVSLDGDRAVPTRNGVVQDTALHPEPEPGELVDAAATAVTDRLSGLMAEPEPRGWPTPAPPASDQPFVLTHPDPDAWAPATTLPSPLAREDEASRGPDLFEPSSPEPQPSQGPEESAAAPGPFEFLPARPAAEPVSASGGLLTDLAVGVLGLAFLSGGIFWAANAKPGMGNAYLNPTTVGLLAGIAGIGFFAVAVYRLLERLTRAAERDPESGSGRDG